MDMFLNQIIQFYSSNEANLYVTQYDVLPHNIEIADNCDVTSPYVFFQ